MNKSARRRPGAGAGRWALWATALTILLLAAPGLGQDSHSPQSQLKFVLIFSRHGVRSPIASNERLNEYSAEPWPNWDVPPGYLTPHGEKLMKLFGAYDRAYLARAGLLTATGCAEAGQVYFWADTDARTLETARALTAGMLPGCRAEAHSQPQGTHDPLFSPFEAGIEPPDRRLAVEAVSARMGGSPATFQAKYRHALETLERVLCGSKPGTPCPPAAGARKKSWFEAPALLRPGSGGHLAVLDGPLHTASTLSENFQLEYAEGMTGHDLGWGRVDEASLDEMLSLHAAYADLMRQTPFIARAEASNLLSHILLTMEQAVKGRAVPGALGKPGDPLVVLVGHDTNISNIAGALGFSWRLQGYQPDDTPPGGALVFELWREPAEGKYSVRAYFICQTLNQMRDALPLTLDSPPARAPLVVAGCGADSEKPGCEWEAFQSAVEHAIEPSYVKP